MPSNPENIEYQEVYNLLTEDKHLMRWLLFTLQSSRLADSIERTQLKTPEAFADVDLSQEVAVPALANVLVDGGTMLTMPISDFMQNLPGAIRATGFKGTETGASFHLDLMAKLGLRLWAIGALELFDHDGQKIAYPFETK